MAAGKTVAVGPAAGPDVKLPRDHNQHARHHQRRHGARRELPAAESTSRALERPSIAASSEDVDSTRSLLLDRNSRTHASTHTRCKFHQKDLPCCSHTSKCVFLTIPNRDKSITINIQGTPHKMKWAPCSRTCKAEQLDRAQLQDARR